MLTDAIGYRDLMDAGTSPQMNLAALRRRPAKSKTETLGSVLLGIAVACTLAGCEDAARTAAGARRPVGSSSLVQLGDGLQREGDAEGANSLSYAAAGKDGRDATALERLGRASLLAGDPARAEQAYRAAVAIDPSADARQGLAMSLLAQRQVREALPLLAALADEQPDPRRLRAYGVALDMAGRQADAQAVYRRGLKLAPADANLHGNLALSLAASGQIDAALSEMRAAHLLPARSRRRPARPGARGRGRWPRPSRAGCQRGRLRPRRRSSTAGAAALCCAGAR